jgi:hypothetical protein
VNGVIVAVCSAYLIRRCWKASLLWSCGWDKMLNYRQITKKNLWVLWSLSIFSASLLAANITMVSGMQSLHFDADVWHCRPWLSRNGCMRWLKDNRYVFDNVPSFESRHSKTGVLGAKAGANRERSQIFSVTSVDCSHFDL